jgi:NTE family protein
MADDPSFGWGNRGDRALEQQFANDIHDADIENSFNASSYRADGVGLALSGGGYKAAAYHLGALIRLNELGYLPKIQRISSVSGGSIAAGYLGLKWKRLVFDAAGTATNFQTEVVAPLHEFLTNVNLDLPEGVLGLLLPFRSGADGVAAAYAEHLYGHATLQDLPKAGAGPEFVIVATNYELNSLWRFSQARAADYHVGEIIAPTFPLARIVAASSAFPPFFCPLKLDFAGQVVQPTKQADHHSGRFLTQALLCDGGIYDNMGLEPIWKDFGTLLVSNAGDFIKEDGMPVEWFGLLLRVVGMIHRQAENDRQMALMALAAAKLRKVAYWPLRNANVHYPKPSPVIPAPAVIAAAQREPVRLWSLGNKAFAGLADHGYSLCDSAARSYLGLVDPVPTPKLPF